MANEMIQEVLRAEQDASDREAAARNRAAEIIATAENTAKADFDAVIAKAEAERTRILEDAKVQAEEIYSKARADAASERERLVAQSTGRQDAAAAAVIQYIIP